MQDVAHLSAYFQPLSVLLITSNKLSINYMQLKHFTIQSKFWNTLENATVAAPFDDYFEYLLH